MSELICKTCGDVYPSDRVSESGHCISCAEKNASAAFAKSVGLRRYPDPTGERYVYNLDGGIEGKKVECVDFIDELWNALVRQAGADDRLSV